MPRPQRSTLFPYTTLFRSGKMVDVRGDHVALDKIKSPKPEGGDLVQDRAFVRNRVGQDDVEGRETIGGDEEKRVAEIEDLDRKSTRLNSSHSSISYAVFCL